MTTVAVIGLGIMGGPMAANLVKADYDVIGYNRSLSKIDRLIHQGGRGAADVTEAARDADVVLTMLPDSPGRSSSGRAASSSPPSPARSSSTPAPSGPRCPSGWPRLPGSAACARSTHPCRAGCHRGDPVHHGRRRGGRRRRRPPDPPGRRIDRRPRRPGRVRADRQGRQPADRRRHHPARRGGAGLPRGTRRGHRGRRAGAGGQPNPRPQVRRDARASSKLASASTCTTKTSASSPRPHEKSGRPSR
jgi:hypothetical protein